LKLNDAVFDLVDEDSAIELVASELSMGRVVGWMNGRMEFGPRSLGNRSILGDPRSPAMQQELNLKVKFRESFRPFAPCVLREDVNKWFELNSDSPYMLFVANVLKEKRLEEHPTAASLFGIEKLNLPRSVIPAVTHLDFSSRIQTVHFDTNPKFYKLLEKFKELTGCPILVNTSFNVRGEPIICTPEDAYRCFMGTNIDLLVIGNIILYKTMQPKNRINNYLENFSLD
jgi:carbamoyltransferase